MLRRSKYQRLARVLRRKLGKSQVITDQYLCHALGTDASVYRLVPKIVVKVRQLDELTYVLSQCRLSKTPFTFRAAGTSLSGQAVSDSVLITLTDHWKQYRLLDMGQAISVQPGMIAADVNRLLKPFGRKIGPDPASIDHCKIGGVAANNASGMCCGIAQNSYHTLQSMSLLLADGTLVNTASPRSVDAFKQSHRSLLSGMNELATRVKQDPELTRLIKHKYRLKNTSGYAINALIDFDDPVDILQHLMIGSEGTLGFIAEITFRTLIDSPCKASALLVFASVELACKAVVELRDSSANAVELMDGRALRSLRQHPDSPDFFSGLDLNACALLIECHADSEIALGQQTRKLWRQLQPFPTSHTLPFTNDQERCQSLWRLRKGLFPIAGANRPAGSCVIIEDIAFAVEDLAEGTVALRHLLDEHGYHSAVIFGHALNGNLHFILRQDFKSGEQLDRYAQFMQSLTDLVALKYTGSLKAEHGTGRNMAPFVEKEWGAQAYAIMLSIKRLLDPDNLLNPGVIFNQDPEVHLKNLKALPECNLPESNLHVSNLHESNLHESNPPEQKQTKKNLSTQSVEPTDNSINLCIECGFCEKVCPSRNLSLTPRQRIVMFRQLHSLEMAGLKRQAASARRQLDYHGVATCAATGLCADACPVGINTGFLIKQLRQQKNQRRQWLAQLIASHYGFVLNAGRLLFRLHQLASKQLSAGSVNAIGRYLSRLSFGLFPRWLSAFPGAASKGVKIFPDRQNPLSKTINQATDKQTHPVEIKPDVAIRQVIYFPACSSRVMNTQLAAADQRGLQQVMASLLQKAGYKVIFPEKIENICCGLPFDSQGFPAQAKQKSDELLASFKSLSQNGKIPVISDNSGCANYCLPIQLQGLSVIDPIAFACTHLLPRLAITPKQETVMLHITCSIRHQGLAKNLVTLARRCATEVVIPTDIDCCGWAGSKGFTTPELNQSALSTLKSQVPAHSKRGFSSSLTCEIGLSQHSGIPYQSILYLLDEVSEPKVRGVK